MIDMGMGQEYKKRAVFFSLAGIDNPEQVFCLFRQTTRVDQDYCIRGSDKIRIRRDNINLPD
jgi:hypothetical protein